YQIRRMRKRAGSTAQPGARGEPGPCSFQTPGKTAVRVSHNFFPPPCAERNLGPINHLPHFRHHPPTPSPPAPSLKSLKLDSVAALSFLDARATVLRELGSLMPSPAIESIG